MRLACAKLRIRHLNAKAYSPESKGKIERFNLTVEEFLGEASLEKPQTLDALNALFRAWLSEGYNHRRTPPYPVKARLRPSPRMLNRCDSPVPRL
jgi:transposase InsO family protein